MGIYRILLGSLLTLTCIAPLAAQKVASLSYAPKIGINFSDILVGQPDVDAALAKLGWNIGLDATYGRKLSASAGLHYYRLGSLLKMKDEDLSSPVRSSQFKMPVGIGYELLKIDYFRLELKGAMVLNYNFDLIEGSLRQRVSAYNRLGLGTRLGLMMHLGRFGLEINFEDSLTTLASDIKYTQNKLVSVQIGIRI